MRSHLAQWRSVRAASLLLAGFVLLLALQVARAHAEDFIIFAPIPPLPEGTPPTGWNEVFDANGGPTGEKRAQIIEALEAAERHPSMATAVGLLRHFDSFSHDDYDAFRQAAIKHRPEIFLMADAAKYELVAQTNLRLQAKSGGGISASVRVGSSGGRYTQWLDWVRRGRPADAMPIDEAFIVSKLFRSDDDVTNWASAEALSADAAANERLNGPGAAREFAQLTQEYLSGYPEAYIAALGGVSRLNPEEMAVEFLSPTKAYNIISKADLRTRHGWSLAMDDLPTYFVELIHSNEQKYNGLFAEEQLHAWGRKAGVVTLDVGDPLKPGSTMSYAQAADTGNLGHIADAQEFPKGINDAFGWMANNYRQIFIVHAGDLDSVAKYTLRMVSWWESVGLTPDAALKSTADFAIPGQPYDADYADIKALMDAIRSPETADQKTGAIRDAGGVDQALAKLKAFNRRQMVAGHRKHIETVTRNLVLALRHHAQQPVPEGSERKPLTLEEAVKLAESQTLVIDEAGKIINHAAIDAQSKQYGAFRQSLDALANAYANLPDDMADDMARDMADQLKRLEAKAKTSPQYDLVLRVLPVVTEAAQTARRRAGGIREGAEAFRSIRKLIDSPLGKALDEHLAEMKQPNLHDYVLKIAKGEVRKRRIHVDWDEGSFGLPKIRIVEEHLTPADVAQDLNRLKDLGEIFLWSNKTLAERFAASFEPDPSGAVNLIRAMGDFYDPARIPERTYSYTDAEGRTVTTIFKPTRFAAGLNLGHVFYLEMLKSPGRFQWAYGIYGDIDNAKKLVENLSKVFIGPPGQTRDQLAAAYSASLAGAIDLVGYAEGFAKSRGRTGVAEALGSDSLVGRYGGSLATIASYASDPLTPEAADALTAALFKDALLIAAPELAPVFLVHGIYSQVSAYLVQTSSESGFIKLLVRNGDWQVPADGSQPRLLGVFADRYIPEDAAGRAAQCKSRLFDTTSRKIAGFSPKGIEPLLKLATDGSTLTVQLCAGSARDSRSRECRATSEQVAPRNAMLDLYKASQFEQTDPAMRSIIDSVNDVAEWSSTQRFMKAVFGQNTSLWTKQHLEDNGIHLDAREDAANFLKTKIAIDDEPKGVVVDGGNWGIPRERAVRTHLQTLSKGSRKIYGYLIAQFWARRQYAMECVLLDPLIAKASETVLKERAKASKPADFIAEVEIIDERVKQIDARLWPLMAEEADPYRDGNMPAGEKLAVYGDFRKVTASQRIDLKTIQDWYTRDQQAFDKVPWQVLFARVVPESDSSTDVEKARAEVGELLMRRGRELLGAMTEVAIAYEKAFGAAMATMHNVDARMAVEDALPGAAGNLSIKPYNLHLFNPDSFTPPHGGFGGPLANLPERQPLIELTAIDADTPLRTREEMLSELTLAMENRLRRITREWEEGYISAADKALDDLTGVVEKLLADLQPLTPLGNVLAAVDVLANPIREFAQAEPADLAQSHPLLPRLTRLRYQIRKLDNALGDGERLDGSRAIDILATMTTYDERGLEAAETMLLDADSAPSTVLSTARSRLEKRYQELLELARRMFDLELTFDGERADIAVYTVTDEAAVEVQPRPIENSGLGVDAIKSLAVQHVWELVSVDGDPIKAQMPGGATGGLEPVACSYDTGEDVMRTNFQAVSSGRTGKLVYPLAESDHYRMRVTVLTNAGVPVSQAEAKLEVRPALLKGKLEGTDAAFAVRLGEKDELDELDARFHLSGAGEFMVALCRFHERELLLPGNTTKRMKGPDWLDQTFVARASTERNGEMAVGPPVEVRFKGDGLFELAEALTVAEEVRVAIEVKVFDASGQPIEATTEVMVGESTIDAQALPAGLTLKDGDRVHVKARLETPAGLVEGSSGLVYVSDEHGRTMKIEVTLPVFAPGNLTVTGRLIAADDGGAGPVAGGRIWANITDSQIPQTVAGDGRFTFVNRTRPVRVADGLALTALAHGPEPERLLLATSGTVRADLVLGPQQPEMEVPVAPFRVGPVKIAATVDDARSMRMEDRAIRVEVGNQPLREAGGRYESTWHFSRWEEEVELSATYPMPSGPDIEQRKVIRLDDVGDPFAPSDPGPVHFELPLYPPGTLQVVYQSRFAVQKPGDDTVAAELRVFSEGSGAGDRWNILVGDDFPLDLSFPVAVNGPDIALTLTAEREGVKITGLAKAPPSRAAAAGKVHKLDLGGLTLGSGEQLVLVPDVTGQPALAARKTLEGAELAVNEVIGKPAERRSLVGKVYLQDPDAGTKSEPRRVKPRTEITTTKFGPVLAPSLKGQPLEAARGILLAAELIIREAQMGPAPEGFSPGTVIEQTPAAGEPVNPDGVVEVRYHTVPDVAEIEDNEKVIPAPVEGEDRLGGGWAGTVKVVSLDFRADGFGSISCASFDGCALELLRLAKEQAEKERRKKDEEEAERQRKMGEDKENGLGEALGALTAPGEAVAAGAGAALGAAMVMAGVFVVDVMFEGIEAGFFLQPAEPSYWLVIPGLPPDIKPFVDEITVTKSDPVTLDLQATDVICNVCQNPGEATGALKGRIRFDETRDRLSLELELTIVARGKQKGDGRVVLTGDLGRSASPPVLTGDTFATIFKERTERPSLDVMLFLKNNKSLFDEAIK